jgi:hypothetical protein
MKTLFQLFSLFLSINLLGAAGIVVTPNGNSATLQRTAIGSGHVSVSDGDGVGGNPTITLSDVTTLTAGWYTNMVFYVDSKGIITGAVNNVAITLIPGANITFTTNGDGSISIAGSAGGASSSNYVVLSANTLNSSNQAVFFRTNFPNSKAASNVAALVLVSDVAETNTTKFSSMDFIGGWYSVPGAGVAGTNLIRPGFRIVAIPTVGAATPSQTLIFMSCTNMTNNSSEWIPAGPWTTNGTLTSAGALAGLSTVTATTGGTLGNIQVGQGNGNSSVGGSAGNYINLQNTAAESALWQSRSATTATNVFVLNGRVASGAVNVFAVQINTNDQAFAVATNGDVRLAHTAYFKAVNNSNTPPAGMAGIFAASNTVAEMMAIDGAGNVTQISAHPLDAPPEFFVTTNWMPVFPEITKSLNLYTGRIEWKNKTMEALLRRLELRGTNISTWLTTLSAPRRNALLSGIHEVETFAEYNARMGYTEAHPAFMTRSIWSTNELGQPPQLLRVLGIQTN